MNVGLPLSSNECKLEWQKTKVIGKGGSSTVFQCKLLSYLPLSKSTTILSSGSDKEKDDEQTEGRCENIALKELQTDGLTNEQIAGLLGEVDTIRGLAHPNVVKYIGTQQLTSAPAGSTLLCILLEFADCGSLRQHYQTHGALHPLRAANCTRQILSGLDYLHNVAGIAHRDIKAANVLLTRGGVVKLADFGASKRFEMDSLVSGLKGTPHWMAPEVIKGTQMTTGWMCADVWSVGCTVVEMCTAALPFEQYENPMTAMYHIASGEAPAIKDLKLYKAAESAEAGNKDEAEAEAEVLRSAQALVKQFVALCCAGDPEKRPSVRHLLGTVAHEAIAAEGHPFLSLAANLPASFFNVCPRATDISTSPSPTDVAAAPTPIASPKRVKSSLTVVSPNPDDDEEVAEEVEDEESAPGGASPMYPFARCDTGATTAKRGVRGGTGSASARRIVHTPMAYTPTSSRGGSRQGTGNRLVVMGEGNEGVTRMLSRDGSSARVNFPFPLNSSNSSSSLLAAMSGEGVATGRQRTVSGGLGDGDGEELEEALDEEIAQEEGVGSSSSNVNVHAIQEEDEDEDDEVLSAPPSPPPPSPPPMPVPVPVQTIKPKPTGAPQAKNEAEVKKSVSSSKVSDGGSNVKSNKNSSAAVSSEEKMHRLGEEYGGAVPVAVPARSSDLVGRSEEEIENDALAAAASGDTGDVSAGLKAAKQDAEEFPDHDHGYEDDFHVEHDSVAERDTRDDENSSLRVNAQGVTAKQPHKRAIAKTVLMVDNVGKNERAVVRKKKLPIRKQNDGNRTDMHKSPRVAPLQQQQKSSGQLQFELGSTCDTVDSSGSNNGTHSPKRIIGNVHIPTHLHGHGHGHGHGHSHGGSYGHNHSHGSSNGHAAEQMTHHGVSTSRQLKMAKKNQKQRRQGANKRSGAREEAYGEHVGGSSDGVAAGGRPAQIMQSHSEKREPARSRQMKPNARNVALGLEHGDGAYACAAAAGHHRGGVGVGGGGYDSLGAVRGNNPQQSTSKYNHSNHGAVEIAGRGNRLHASSSSTSKNAVVLEPIAAREVTKTAPTKSLFSSHGAGNNHEQDEVLVLNGNGNEPPTTRKSVPAMSRIVQSAPTSDGPSAGGGASAVSRSVCLPPIQSPPFQSPQGTRETRKKLS